MSTGTNNKDLYFILVGEGIADRHPNLNSK